MADPNSTRLRYDTVSTFVLVPRNHPQAPCSASPMQPSGTRASFTVASPVSSTPLPSYEAHHSSAIIPPSYYSPVETLPGICDNSQLRPQGPVQFVAERSVSYDSSSSSQINITVDTRGRERRRRRNDDDDKRAPRKFRWPAKRQSQSSYQDEDDEYSQRSRSRSNDRGRGADTDGNDRRSRTRPQRCDEDKKSPKKIASDKCRTSEGKKKLRGRSTGSEDSDFRQQRRLASTTRGDVGGSMRRTGSLVEINVSDNGEEAEASIVIKTGALAEALPSAPTEAPAARAAPATSGPLAGICGFFTSLLGLRSSEPSAQQAPQTVIILSPPPPPPPPPASETSSSSTEQEPELLYEVCALDQKQLRALCSNINLRTVVKEELDEQEKERERREVKKDKERRKRMKKMKAEELKKAAQEERERENIEREVRMIAEKIEHEEAARLREEARRAEELAKLETAKERTAEPPMVAKIKVEHPKLDDVIFESLKPEEPIQTEGTVGEPPQVEAEMMAGEKVEEPPPDMAGTVSPSLEGGLAEPLQVSVPVVFVFGGPGSGRGTQCAKIVEKYGFVHVSSGDLLRAEVIAGTERGKEIYQIMQKADLVPLDYVICLLKEAIEGAMDTAKGYLIDGYPRNVAQAERFEKEVCKCTNILYFEVSDDTMAKRILERGKTSGRVEDKAELVKHRLDIFHGETEPVLQRYKDVVFKVNAEANPQDVFEAVVPFFNAITMK